MPDLPVAAPDPAAAVKQIIGYARFMAGGENDRIALEDCAAADTALTALLVERQQDKERIERLEKALVTAALPLEVLRGQIAVKPYRELTAELQQQIVEATDAIRAALAVEEDAENG